MKIAKIICNKDFTLVVQFDNGEIRKVDYRPQLPRWRKSTNKAYQMLAKKENFLSASIDGGDIIFPKVKVNGKTAYFDGDTVYKAAPAPKKTTTSRKAQLSGIEDSVRML